MPLVLGYKQDHLLGLWEHRATISMIYLGKSCLAHPRCGGGQHLYFSRPECEVAKSRQGPSTAGYCAEPLPRVRGEDLNGGTGADVQATELAGPAEEASLVTKA